MSSDEKHDGDEETNRMQKFQIRVMYLWSFFTIDDSFGAFEMLYGQNYW